ncbi:MAG: translation initiation factor IF-2 [Tissierellia bacterium]|nr:translation initiation factor IF-2 [Tissierellia bacterium]
MKKRVHELAKKLKVSSKDIINRMRELDIEVKNPMSMVSEEDCNKVIESFKPAPKKTKKKPAPRKKSPVETVNERREKERIEREKKEAQQRAREKELEESRKLKEAEERAAKEKLEKQIAEEKKQKSNKKKAKKEKDIKTSESTKKSKASKKSKQKDMDKDIKQKKKSEKISKMKKDEKKPRYTRDLSKKTIGKHVKKPKKEQNPNLIEEGKYEIYAPISVKEFADIIEEPVSQVIMKLIGLGIMANQNESIEKDVAILVADEFDKEVVINEPVEEDLEDLFDLDKPDDEKDLLPRPPVVTVMGHVDHGKTSLLDAIKSSRVTAGEAGGITQHIGAYMVNVRDKKITFLDTPGHEAFTMMRSRGAQITDIAILVVAADDGVMPQTIEAISHAKAANVPIIVAINKIDKPEANPERVKQELVEHGLVPEDWGGDTVTVDVSAKSKQGIDDLLDMIILVSDMGELKANPNRLAIGTVIEAKLDIGKGPLATVLIQKGTLKDGDVVASGSSSGKIRSMIDDKNRKIKKAGPSVPVEIQGMSEVPNAGDPIYAFKDEKTARLFSEKNFLAEREMQLRSSNVKVSLDNLFERIKEGDLKELNIVLKADVRGTIEAIIQSLEKLNTDEVKINVIHHGVGGISESDITLASASNALVIGFNIRPNNNALELAKTEEIDVRTYRIIYDLLNDIEAAVKGMHAPTYSEEMIGRAEVRQTFKIPGGNVIAGVYVLNGKITRQSNIRVLRDDYVIFDGAISSLRRFKDDVREINAGYEAGIGVESFNDVKVGDILEAYIMKEEEYNG